jgi:hypothetical protein
LQREDLIAFRLQMKKQSLSDRTAFNYLGYIVTFLRRYKVPKLLERHDWPKPVKRTTTKSYDNSPSCQPSFAG